MAFYINDVDVKRYINEPSSFDIIGDIHGCLKELYELLEKLKYKKQGNIYVHPQGRKLVSVGDLNDRGPENLQVILFWINMVNMKKAIYVHGNHCDKFYRYLIGRKVKIAHGLETTVKEYKNLSINEQEIFRTQYIKFYEQQAYYWILDEGRLVVCHGSIKEEWIGKMNQRIQSHCLFGDVTGEVDDTGHPIRRDWARDYKGDAFIVYGHTPVLEPIFIGNTIDIDQGCVFGGKLTAFRYPEKEIVQVCSHMPKDVEILHRMKDKYEGLATIMI